MPTIESLRKEIARLKRQKRLEEERERRYEEIRELKRTRRNLRLAPLRRGIKRAKRVHSRAKGYYGKAKKKLAPFVSRGQEIFGLNQRFMR